MGIFPDMFVTLNVVSPDSGSPPVVLSNEKTRQGVVGTLVFEEVGGLGVFCWLLHTKAPVKGAFLRG